MGKNYIRIGGAREHNLQNISATIPRNKLVVFTGLSGSGKSSLVFDTLFAEGQRKYVESLSTYARQFLNQLQKPDVDFIEGLSPAIAIEQRFTATNPRSTIATTTELFDFLRLLFAHVGQPHCPDTGIPISQRTTSDIVDEILALPKGSRVMLLAPVVVNQKGEFRDVLNRLGREGFVRARIDGKLLELTGNTRVKLDPANKHRIDVVVDRLIINEKIRVRLSDSTETALKWGQGVLIVLRQDKDASAQTDWAESYFSNKLYSPATGKVYDCLTPRHFSFNSPQGACATCLGLGQIQAFDPELVIPNRKKSLQSVAVAPWNRGGKRLKEHYLKTLSKVAKHYGSDIETPYDRLPEDCQHTILYGTTSENGFSFEGVIPQLQKIMDDSDTESTAHRLKGFMRPKPCQHCKGKRLRPEILAVRLGTNHKLKPQERADNPALPGYSIMDICSLSIADARRFFVEITLTDTQQKIASEPITEIRNRLNFLERVGLGYLSLNRESGTLSGGEAQRIRLATQIGAGLVGVLYILDEPSIGLHQRDNQQLLETLAHLRDMGNSVLVVEHDEDTIRQADIIVDMGPGAGHKGGKIVAMDSPAKLETNPDSLTGKYLSGEFNIQRPGPMLRLEKDHLWLEVVGATENNLKSIDARFPLQTFTCVTGVSGSGKSTLVNNILKRTLTNKWHQSKEKPGKHRTILGEENLGKVATIDQTPLGRTPRSNPATYTGIFQHIRDLFAKLPAARVRGFGPSRFSFNVKGGRCEKCQGDGVIRIDMQFLPPVYVTCESCGGKRYNRETLEISYKGRNIANVLSLTVDEAVVFFRTIPKIRDICQTLAAVGLGYIQLGQQATTLSGGEAQRVKIATELCKKSGGRTLYIMDEPTTGLHFHDVATLLNVIFQLRDAGNTLIVIEHNIDVIKCADWVIDLGPEGGDKGGHIVAEGAPEHLATISESHTGRYLKQALQRDRLCKQRDQESSPPSQTQPPPR
ncbi:MAG: UvrABC system protein A [Verrucomicrobia subdivision 3 bacterium]|nr:UvrABC system protein A [Limisphaerales bacterium]MCS1412679.1 UvrABC system protein A [Limisphaerales bacterium]